MSRSLIPPRVMAAIGVILAFIVCTILAIPSIEDIGNIVISSIYHVLRPMTTGQAVQTLDTTFALWLLIYALLTLAGLITVFTAMKTIMKWAS